MRTTPNNKYNNNNSNNNNKTNNNNIYNDIHNNDDDNNNDDSGPKPWRILARMVSNLGRHVTYQQKVPRPPDPWTKYRARYYCDPNRVSSFPSRSLYVMWAGQRVGFSKG